MRVKHTYVCTYILNIASSHVDEETKVGHSLRKQASMKLSNAFRDESYISVNSILINPPCSQLSHANPVIHTQVNTWLS